MSGWVQELTPEQTRWLNACSVACHGIPVEALEAGKLGEALEALRYFIVIDGGGGCAPGVEGHDCPCGCDLQYAEENAGALLRALGRVP